MHILKKILAKQINHPFLQEFIVKISNNILMEICHGNFSSPTLKVKSGLSGSSQLHRFLTSWRMLGLVKVQTMLFYRGFHVYRFTDQYDLYHALMPGLLQRYFYLVAARTRAAAGSSFRPILCQQQCVILSTVLHYAFLYFIWVSAFILVVEIGKTTCWF